MPVGKEKSVGITCLKDITFQTLETASLENEQAAD